jgi:hypothetical protein
MIAGPIKFDMGSSISEKDRFAPETPHEMLIPRSFAIAAKPVTVKQFHEFDPKHKFTERYAPTPDCPVITVFWHHAAAYCNWLSEQEGLKPDQFCYETDSQGQVTRLKKDYLHLTGYRLPTSAEMEYACRAGSRTSRFYGSAEELLPYYAWYVNDSDGQTHPVGSKQPNDFGLFDVLGNVWNWCQDRYIRGDDPPRTRDDEEPLVINNLDNRVVRCGAYNVLPWNLRSANFNFHLPIHRDIFIGFRVARTIAVDGER